MDKPLSELINLSDTVFEEYRLRAADVREKYYGKKVFIRGLVEISNICRNDCYYCGIRKSNPNVKRYSMTSSEILSSVKSAYGKGIKSFVLQGGENNLLSDDELCNLIFDIKASCPGSAVTLSLGERTRESYHRLRASGADRYLLREETASSNLYGKLHPASMSLENRKKCLYDLAEEGFQVGAGFMVGVPYQTIDDLEEEIKFLHELNPHMIGIGPFISQKDTPFASFPDGSAKLTLRLISILRLEFPKAMLPSTTALGTSMNDGREKGLLFGANVVMPNITPICYRENYALYDNKLSTGAESVEGLSELCKKISGAGFEPEFSRGDHIDFV